MIPNGPLAQEKQKLYTDMEFRKTTSTFFKRSLLMVSSMDVVDAMNDVARLATLLEMEFEAIQNEGEWTKTGG